MFRCVGGLVDIDLRRGSQGTFSRGSPRNLRRVRVDNLHPRLLQREGRRRGRQRRQRVTVKERVMLLRRLRRRVERVALERQRGRGRRR